MYEAVLGLDLTASAIKFYTPRMFRYMFAVHENQCWQFISSCEKFWRPFLFEEDLKNLIKQQLSIKFLKKLKNHIHEK